MSECIPPLPPKIRTFICLHIGMDTIAKKTEIGFLLIQSMYIAYIGWNEELPVNGIFK